MSNKSSEFESRSAGEGFLRLLFARPSGFACHTLRNAMRLRSTVSARGRRCEAQVSHPAASRSFGRASVASVGSRRFLRVTKASLRRACCLSTRLRATVSVGHPSVAMGKFPGESRSCGRPFAATRGFRRFLRATETSLAMPPVGPRSSPSHLSGVVRPPAFPYHSAATPQREATPNKGAAANCSARHGSCYSRSLPSRSVVAWSHVRCLSLRSTFAATAPRSAAAELGR